MKLNYQTNLKKFNILIQTKKWKIWAITINIVTWSLFFCFTYFYSDFKFQQPDDIHKWKIISAAISGLFLSFSGSAMQGVTRNQLAGPSTLGMLPITTTGLIFYLLVDKSFPHTVDVYLKYIFSIIIGLFVLTLIYFIVNKKTHNQYLIILLGLAIGIVFGSINALLIKLFPSLLVSSSPWLGQLQVFVDWKLFYISVPLMILGAIIVLINGKKINIIENNMDLAITLGINHKRTFWFVAIGSLFISVAVSYLTGTVIGLAIVVPYLSKKILSTNNFYLNSLFSSFFTSTILMIAMLLDSVYSFGLNLFCSAFVLPLFLLIIVRRKI